MGTGFRPIWAATACRSTAVQPTSEGRCLTHGESTANSPSCPLCTPRYGGRYTFGIHSGSIGMRVRSKNIVQFLPPHLRLFSNPIPHRWILARLTINCVAAVQDSRQAASLAEPGSRCQKTVRIRFNYSSRQGLVFASTSSNSWRERV